MICCLNPNCQKPINPDGSQHCEFCKTPLIELLDGRYRIIAPLGQGGFARTYRAENTRIFDTPCVVKQLAPAKQRQGFNQIDPIIVELFEREARLLQKLEGHSQIPRLVDYFNQDGFLYLVQDLIEGKTLAHEFKAKACYTEADVRQFLQNLLPVLTFVHQSGVVHRDLKPSNIMCRPNGQLVLIDFGVSTELEDSLQTRHSSIAPGTHGYTAFEQLNKIVKPTSDLYSVGVICFHLLTRRSPSDLWLNYGFSWTQRWQSFLSPEIEMSESLTNVMTGLLRQDYQHRYQSPHAVLQDLGVAQPGLVFSSPVTPPHSPSDDELTTAVTTQNFTEDLNGVPLEMIYIPAGGLEMGSPNGVGDDDEHPQHPVDVSAFYMGKYPVTQAQYTAIVGNNPSRFKGENLPVEQVSWFDALRFCQNLAAMFRNQYRLPSEAEWEYACCAGTAARYYFGDDEAQLTDYAWYADNSSSKTHPVGQRKPNQWGLCDMHGNMWEWCEDTWHDNYNGAPSDGSAWISENKNDSLRLLRGGSWLNLPWLCRSAFRFRLDADLRYNNIGFRVVYAAART
jgi:formylglycine-generating enzyme required for sulfatase activity/tRNA A-37 threonylcarbamoyl transferase component Bud32